VAACAAATKADVELALGARVGSGKEETAGIESSCDYNTENGQVTISIQKLTRKLDVTAEIASLKAAIPEGKVREAQGLGTQAFFMDIEGVGTQLHVIRAEREHLLVSILGFGEPAQVSAAAQAIARKALTRLGAN
jgi:hypothetical protein